MRSNPIKLAWLEDPNNQESKEQVSQQLNTFINSALGKRLLTILDQQLKSTELGEIKPSYYDCPSWAPKQAHLNGYRQHIQQMYELLQIGE